jgi:hypothetical protein
MIGKYQLPALALAAGLVAVALALLDADRIGEGLVLSVVALIAVRRWARRRADAYLSGLARIDVLGKRRRRSRPPLRSRAAAQHVDHDHPRRGRLGPGRQPHAAC